VLDKGHNDKGFTGQGATSEWVEQLHHAINNGKNRPVLMAFVE
jgi:hypothetical protein